MRVLVIRAHPVETSFCAALHATVLTSLGSRGHEIDDCDLYAEEFDPVLRRAERLAYHDQTRNQQPIASYLARLLRAEAVVFCFPVWCYGVPAMLKGYFDRVLVPGGAFALAGGKTAPLLTNIKRIVVVTTYGAARWQVAFGIGDIPRAQMVRFFRWFTGGASVRYLALYHMNVATEARRAAFIARVGRELAAI